MKLDLSALKINRAILHEIPKHARAEEGSGAVLSDVPSALDAAGAVFFKDRISACLMAKGFEIMFDALSTSPVREAVIAYLAKPTEARFVKMSQDLAKHLYASQDGINPAGILMVIDCSLMTRKVIAILKLEQEEGARVARKMVDQKRSLDVQHLQDLILTQRTRLFKVAAFASRDEASETFDAVCSDMQRGYDERVEVAGFFLKRFLGCKLTEEPEVATKKFYEATEGFINEEVKDPIRRMKYHEHLVSEMGSNKEMVEPVAFANAYFVVEDRKPFTSYLTNRAVSTTAFKRKTELIDKRLEKELFQFESGIDVLVRKDVPKDRIRTEKLASGELKLEIQDYLKSIRGK